MNHAGSHRIADVRYRATVLRDRITLLSNGGPPFGEVMDLVLGEDYDPRWLWRMEQMVEVAATTPDLLEIIDDLLDDLDKLQADRAAASGRRSGEAA